MGSWKALLLRFSSQGPRHPCALAGRVWRARILAAGLVTLSSRRRLSTKWHCQWQVRPVDSDVAMAPVSRRLTPAKPTDLKPGPLGAGALLHLAS
jgi:hypothetical protein